MTFIIIPLHEDEDADLIDYKKKLLQLFNNPEEPGEAPYMAGRIFADLIRNGMKLPDGE